MLPPALVVGVVSPGKASLNRDYRYKKSEYAARGIDEYWIVDPLEDKLTVWLLDRGLYEEKVYRGNDEISSRMFSQLQLTVEQIFG